MFSTQWKLFALKKHTDRKIVNAENNFAIPIQRLLRVRLVEIMLLQKPEVLEILGFTSEP